MAFDAVAHGGATVYRGVVRRGAVRRRSPGCPGYDLPVLVPPGRIGLLGPVPRLLLARRFASPHLSLRHQ